jgi:hypothetical protein
MSEGRKYRQAVAALDALYAELPTIECHGGCAAACGPIPLTELEARRLQVTTHRKPRTLVLMPTVDGRGDTRRERCIYLSAADRCTAYAVRPLLCRAYGALKAMSCPRGCLPSAWLTPRAFVRLALAIEQVGGGRLLVTTPDGLALNPGGGFASLLDPGRSETAIEADAERTRSLRALHGGRILAVVKHE